MAGTLPDPRQALSASDVLVLPSAYEANPLVVLEALAAGLQVVATPVGSVPELLANDEVSKIVERTSEGVCGGLAALAAADVAPEEVRRRARSIAETMSWDIVAAKYLELFDQMDSKDDLSR
ncbi:glycosyltransferase [Ornithinimicrobium sp. CNJ-824]|uniref:glycosyltransferase n=1 Tax=Ornithinimicrobium sp. CNJ-824 TaxID=1904966 RepID=UPI0009FB5106|nr:glycosyltransferase [Ornithinimicrobium sp. CNJ-824]